MHHKRSLELLTIMLCKVLDKVGEVGVFAGENEDG
jgi:hypothetical protein